ncbi:protein FAM174C-like [Carcharodon carcharias]|uniref:protein FAM174C-like n=1 Tax=Carcharodon carcharias TaxID=13397 RepID=UPI001B7E1D31|nr:protein FAM174C-like [Carcharodon carcharias]
MRLGGGGGGGGGPGPLPLPLPGSVSLLLAAALGLSLVLPAAAYLTTKPETVTGTGTGTNSSSGSSSGSSSPPPRQGGYPDKSVIRRALWVLLGITGLGLLYFIIRSIRLKKTQRKKYGLLSSYDDHVEMAPMDTDDDDTTLFEVKGMRR